LMSDVLKIRCISVVACSTMIAFNYFRPKPIMLAVRFNLLFLAIHAFKIAEIVRQRQDIMLDDLEAVLYEQVFATYLSKVAMRQMIRVGGRVDAKQGSTVLHNDGPFPRKVQLIVVGHADVIDSAHMTIATLQPGDWIGETQYLKRYPPQSEIVERRVSVRCNEPCTLVEWDADALDKHLEEDVMAKHALEALWAEGLALKLEDLMDGRTVVHANEGDNAAKEVDALGRQLEEQTTKCGKTTARADALEEKLMAEVKTRYEVTKKWESAEEELKALRRSCHESVAAAPAQPA